MNRWNIIAVYAAIICTISMGCILFNTITMARDMLRLTLPWYLETNVYGLNMNYQDIESYRNFRCPERKNETPCSLAGKSDSEITAMREHDGAEYRNKLLNNTKEQTLKSFLDSIVTIAISLVFFIVHWRIARRVLQPNP